jgi:hypothetical protein
MTLPPARGAVGPQGFDGGRRARLETKDGRDEAVDQDRRQVFRSGEEAMRTTRHW